MWGEELSDFQDVVKVFAKFLKNEVKKLPWCAECPAKILSRK